MDQVNPQVSAVSMATKFQGYLLLRMADIRMIEREERKSGSEHISQPLKVLVTSSWGKAQRSGSLKWVVGGSPNRLLR